MLHSGGSAIRKAKSKTSQLREQLVLGMRQLVPRLEAERNLSQKGILALLLIVGRLVGVKILCLNERTGSLKFVLSVVCLTPAGVNIGMILSRNKTY